MYSTGLESWSRFAVVVDPKPASLARPSIAVVVAELTYPALSPCPRKSAVGISRPAEAIRHQSHVPHEQTPNSEWLQDRLSNHRSLRLKNSGADRCFIAAQSKRSSLVPGG